MRAIYGTNNDIRLLYCRTCKYKFSEQRGTALFDFRLSQEKVVAIDELVDECNGVKKTSQRVESQSGIEIFTL